MIEMENLDSIESNTNSVKIKPKKISNKKEKFVSKFNGEAPSKHFVSYDDNLNWSLSFDEIKLIIKNNLEEIQNLQKNRLFIGNYPSRYTIAKCALKSYKNEPKLNETQFPNWETLVTCKSPVESNAYFGVVFWNRETQQIVIAHRGSLNYGSILNDFQIFIGKEFSPQINSAVTFCHEIFSILREIQNEFNKEIFRVKFEVFITGHSLGGFLAQITNFTSKFVKRQDDSEDFGCIHPHTLCLDSPGAKSYLEILQKNYGPQIENLSLLKELSIVNFIIKFNSANCLSEHLERTLLKIIVKDPKKYKRSILEKTNKDKQGNENKSSSSFPLTQFQRNAISLIQVFDPNILSHNVKSLCKELNGELNNNKIIEVRKYPKSLISSSIFNPKMHYNRMFKNKSRNPDYYEDRLNVPYFKSNVFTKNEMKFLNDLDANNNCDFSEKEDGIDYNEFYEILSEIKLENGFISNVADEKAMKIVPFIKRLVFAKSYSC